MRKENHYSVAAAIALLFVACGDPKVEPSCTMNGFGAGACSFTNTGTSAGSVCGRVVVRRSGQTDKAESALFCSGEVGKRSTTKVDFTIPGVSDLCGTPNPLAQKWSDVCSFGFTASTKESEQERKDEERKHLEGALKGIKDTLKGLCVESCGNSGLEPTPAGAKNGWTPAQCKEQCGPGLPSKK